MMTLRIHQLILGAAACAGLALAQSDGSFQVGYSANLKTLVSNVIYSTDGVPPGFAATGYHFTTAPSPSCANTGTIAFKFLAGVTSAVSTVSAGLVTTANGPTSVTFHIMTDSSNAPGSVIDNLTFNGLTTTAQLLTANSTVHPVLTAGTSYWLSADPPACAATAQSYDWTLAAPTLAGTVSFGGGAGTAFASTAFDVIGQSALESIVDFTNTGANNAQDICVNTYTFSPDEQLVSCCSCRVTRNALYSLGVNRDLTSNTLTPGVERSVVIKLLATSAPAAGPCNPSNPGAPARGLAAWGTTAHLSNLTSGTIFGSETPFTNSTLSAAELSVMTSFCGFIQANGSGFGICRACQAGTNGLGPNNDQVFRTGLGAGKQ